jgi:hypothetical protein
MSNGGPKKLRGGKGNWYVHQRGAAPIAYPSRRAARRATKSLRNATVSRYYQHPANYNGAHSVSDDKPGRRIGCPLSALVLLAGVGSVAGVVASLVD